MKKIFNPGTLCKVRLSGLISTKDGFATVGSSKNPRCARVYREINLFSYPSVDDFFGESTVVSEKDIVTILKHLGRPEKIGRDPEWFEYDVYEVLVKGAVRQMFKQNLEEIHKKKK